MNRTLKLTLAALVVAGCTAFSPPDQGCSTAIIEEYRQVTQTAALNRAQTTSIFQGLGGTAAPINTFIAASEAPFCRSRPRSVLCRGNTQTQKLTLEQVTTIDRRLRAEFTYVSDEVLHKRNDWWTNDRTCGDCEDYALILSERLSIAGQKGEGMALMLWSPAPGLAHATLMVDTADAGVVEVGVGSAETPHAMDWNKGQRVAYMLMDGRRNWLMRARWS